MNSISLIRMNAGYCIHQLPADAEIPKIVFGCDFYSVSRNPDEITIVLPEDVIIESVSRETGWAGIKVLGPLDFSLTGILSGISDTLAREEVSIFAISTFDTDYILVKKEDLGRSEQALTEAGYPFLSDEE